MPRPCTYCGFFRRLFGNGYCRTAGAFGADSPAAEARTVQLDGGLDLPGVRWDVLVEGYARSEDLTKGECGDPIRPFAVEDLVADSEPPVATIRSLAINQRRFVTLSGRPGAIITLPDLEKATLHMLLFGTITLVEMLAARQIRENFSNDSWREIVSLQRLVRAPGLQQERLRRNNPTERHDCLQLSDKCQILLRNSDFINAAEFYPEAKGKKR